LRRRCRAVAAIPVAALAHASRVPVLAAGDHGAAATATGALVVVHGLHHRALVAVPVAPEAVTLILAERAVEARARAHRIVLGLRGWASPAASRGAVAVRRCA